MHRRLTLVSPPPHNIYIQHKTKFVGKKEKKKKETTRFAALVVPFLTKTKYNCRRILYTIANMATADVMNAVECLMAETVEEEVYFRSYLFNELVLALILTPCPS